MFDLVQKLEVHLFVDGGSSPQISQLYHVSLVTRVSQFEDNDVGFMNFYFIMVNSLVYFIGNNGFGAPSLNQ
jgi:hypothetical protein